MSKIQIYQLYIININKKCNKNKEVLDGLLSCQSRYLFFITIMRHTLEFSRRNKLINISF